MQHKLSPCKDPDTDYVWLGGSCDYGRKERFGGGAYIIEYKGKKIDTYVISESSTTEFRMMLTVMIHALNTLPAESKICFLTNVAYLQNFDKTPTEGMANTDLIAACNTAKKRHLEVSLKLVPYHKYPEMQDAHEMAHQAMLRLRT